MIDKRWLMGMTALCLLSAQMRGAYGQTGVDPGQQTPMPLKVSVDEVNVTFHAHLQRLQAFTRLNRECYGKFVVEV